LTNVGKVAIFPAISTSVILVDEGRAGWRFGFLVVANVCKVANFPAVGTSVMWVE
jgi:hypothetical protein